MGILGNVVTGYILEKTGDYRLIFMLTAAIYLSSFFTWIVFMKGRRLRLADIEITRWGSVGRMDALAPGNAL